MSFAVRDWVHARRRAPIRVEERVTPSNVDEEGIARIFADSVGYFRRKSKYRRAWRKVARIKSQPGWVASIPTAFVHDGPVRTCGGCGHEFPAFGAGNHDYCSPECRQPLPCGWCGRAFLPTNGNQRFCSETHWRAARNARRRDRYAQKS